MKLFFLTILLSTLLFSDYNHEFIGSDSLKKMFPEIQEIEDVVQDNVNNWKKEIDSLEKDILILQKNINQRKSSLNNSELKDLNQKISLLEERINEYSKSIFDNNGKLEKLIDSVFKPLEKKINKELESLKK